MPARTQHYAQSIARNHRVLTITAQISAAVSGFFGLLQMLTGRTRSGSA